jgi:AcrR family transcriptional regulator
MDGFTRRKEQSKEDIRKAAWQLFSQFGVEKVSMNDIACKAEVSPATIYNNFGGKDAPVQEFITTMVDRLMGDAETILALDAPFEQKVAALLHYITDKLVNTTPTPDNPLFSGSVDLHNDPQIKRIRESAEDKMTQLVMELVAEGKREGQVNPALSDEALAIYFSFFIEAFVRPEYQIQFHQNPKLISDLGSLMLYGLIK